MAAWRSIPSFSWILVNCAATRFVWKAATPRQTRTATHEGGVMSEGLAVWSTLFLLGAYHGINPGMGWLFAVARGMQEHRARAVAWSLPPIALGHALSVGAVVLAAGLAQMALPLAYIRIGVAVTLVALGVYKLIRSRHFRWGG